MDGEDGGAGAFRGGRLEVYERLVDVDAWGRGTFGGA